ncbi:hypothetical protein BASA81_001535 [Batrachochytrium salamandrivorans]|nr:hypothetical protein BASA81_001535 [Batrachochytrium salamandrivorans]
MQRNLSLVSPLTAESAVGLLQERYVEQKPYTIAQDQVLVAVNPQRDLGLNGRKSWSLHDSNSELAEPHVYSISSCVQRRFVVYDSQAVFCCGESGSGKTESAKLILEHFASYSPHTNSSIVVQSSNPILEAFGNAATEANANSSRFGKVLTLAFSPHGTHELQNCQVKTFLFERSRVCGNKANPRERNFHIFYQLLASPEWSQVAGVGHKQQFQILNRLGESGIRNDLEDFNHTLAGLGAMQIPLNVQYDLMKALGAILHIGQFQGRDSLTALQTAAGLLQTSNLCEFFAKRSVTVRNETIWMDNTVEQSLQLRDLLCKELYLVAFECVLGAINRASGLVPESSKTCYLVDIMGFECLWPTNALEQLLINYANEKIFDLFVSTQVCAVEEEYVREGIEFEAAESRPASAVLDMFDSPSSGLWRLLESEGHTPGGTDGGFLRKLKQTFPGLVGLEKRTSSTNFTIQHYAGPVTYLAEGFLEKSLHRTSLHLVELLHSSRLVQGFGLALPDHLSAKRTIGTVFQREMNDLIATLRSVEKISWIRCIRPTPAANAAAGAGEFDIAYVKQQLEQSGILSAIQISRSALPIRLALVEFLSLSNYWDGIDQVIDRGEEVKFGKTLVYLTDRVFSKLIEHKQRHLAAVKLQWRVRLWIATKELRKVHRAATKLAQWWRKKLVAVVPVIDVVAVVPEVVAAVVPEVAAAVPAKRPSAIALLVEQFEESKVVFAPTLLPAPVNVFVKQLEMEERIAALERLVEEKDLELERERKRAQRETKDLTRRVQELQREVTRLRGDDEDDQNRCAVNVPPVAKRAPPPPASSRSSKANPTTAGILGLLLYPNAPL